MSPGYGIELLLMLKFQFQGYKKCGVTFYNHSFSGQLWSSVVVSVRVRSLTHIELFNHFLRIIITLLLFTPLEFFTSVLADSFSLEFEWQQVSSSLQDSSQYSGRLSNAVVWVVPTRPPTSKSSRPFNNPLVTVPNAPMTIGTIVTLMFTQFFFNSLARSRYLSFFLLSFRFILWSAGTAKSTILQILFLLLIIMRSGLLAEIRWSVCMLKSHRSLCESFSRTGAGLCIYHLFLWSNWNFLHISQWITLPTQSCLALNSFCANLLHSLIMWLIVSSLSPHSLHLLFCCVLSILALIYY